MNQHPGILVIALACLAVAGIGLWPSAPAQKNAAVNVYFEAPQTLNNSGYDADSEAALDEDPYGRDDEGVVAQPEEGYPSAI